MSNLWSENKPANFWQCQNCMDQLLWLDAEKKAARVLDYPQNAYSTDHLLSWTLGEAQFGEGRWKMKPAYQFYYRFRRFIPRKLRHWLRSKFQVRLIPGNKLKWPIEDRYVQFQFNCLENFLALNHLDAIAFRNIWPEKNDFALVITHDIESLEGQKFASQVADLEEELGFRSSFNLVVEDYKIDTELVADLRSRGFEIGIHGLHHDDSLFKSVASFKEQAVRANEWFKKMDAVGFRSPSTHRQPEWMQALEAEYDLSFFDTDPWEPIPGGTMSIWPFFLGHLIELPYTLAQDNTMFNILRDSTPSLWLNKVNFIRQHFGMALVNTHPDYLKEQRIRSIYRDFLLAMKDIPASWNPLPAQAASWWRIRQRTEDSRLPPHVTFRTAYLEQGKLQFSWQSDIAEENDFISSSHPGIPAASEETK